MKAHLICERDVGLFSLIQQVIAHIPWAERAGRTPIVLFADRCAYWTPEGHRERDTVWEYYFEPLDPAYPVGAVPQALRRAVCERFPDPRDVGHAVGEGAWASSHFGDHPALRGRTLAIPHGWRDPDARLRQRAAHIIVEHIRPRPYVIEAVDTFEAAHMRGREVIGVHIRGTDAVSEREDRAHRKGSLVLDRYREAVERQIEGRPAAAIFVATDDQRSLDFMRAHFGDRVIAHDAHRHLGGESAGRGPTGALMPAYVTVDPAAAARNGEEAVVEWLLLARCRHLIHNGSSLARTALLLDPSLPHTNTHRKSRLVAHAQTFSLRKLRRGVRRTVRRAAGAARGLSSHV